MVGSSKFIIIIYPSKAILSSDSQTFVFKLNSQRPTDFSFRHVNTYYYYCIQSTVQPVSNHIGIGASSKRLRFPVYEKCKAINCRSNKIYDSNMNKRWHCATVHENVVSTVSPEAENKVTKIKIEAKFIKFFSENKK